MHRLGKQGWSRCVWPSQAGPHLCGHSPIQNAGLTTHLRSARQEVFAGHEGLLAAKARSDARFCLRRSQDLPAREGGRVCQLLEIIRIHVHATARTAAW